jgi:hypothetical protein
VDEFGSGATPRKFPDMKTLHIAPGDSAGGSLIRAIRDAGQDDDVLPFRDDLSCGPIEPDTSSTRAAWWDRFYEASEAATPLGEFWDRVAATDDRLVVWFGRHSARELAFFLAWVDRLGERPYHIIDVTERPLPFRQRDGSFDLRPAAYVSIVRHEALRLLLGSERPITTDERKEISRDWRKLRAENAPFRIVTEGGLASAPLDYFDSWILRQAAPEWRSVARVVGGAMGDNCEPYFQVYDLMLQARVVALVAEGKLLAEVIRGKCGLVALGCPTDGYRSDSSE